MVRRRAVTRDYLWQWTGGATPNGITNFRVAQIDGNSVNGRTCA